MASYSDNFNRASLGTDWPDSLNGGTWNINASVRARQQQTTGTYRARRYVSPMDTGDVDVTVVVRGTAGSGVGVLVRCPQTGTATADIDGYAIVAYPGDAFYIIRLDGGDDSGLGYGYTWGSVTAGTDYTLRITVQGTTVTGYVDGTQRFTFTDSTYTGGSGNRGVALLSYGATPEWDSFTALDIVSGQTVTPGALASTATVYSPVVSQSGGAQTVQPGAIASGASVPAPVVVRQQFVQPDPVSGAEYALRFYGNGTGQIDRARIPLEDGASTQYPVNVGAGSFTYEAWIRCAYADNASTATDEDARYSNIVFDRDDYNAQRGHVWGVTRSGSNLVVCFGQAGSGGSWTTIFTTTNIGDNAWHHVAITRNQSTGAVTVWVDGANEASGTYDTTDWSFPAGRVNPLGQDNEYIVLGTEKHDVGYGYNGHLDELRISNVVRYTGAFSPVRRLATDSNAVGLYRFDTGTGTIVADSATVSGAPTNGELLVGGTPSGPVWVAASTGTLAPSAVVHAPTVVQSAVTVVPGAISSGATVHAPTAQPGARTVVPGVLASTSTVHAPTAQPGGVSVAVGAIAGTSTVHAPTAQPGAVTVVPGAISSGAVVYAPTANTGANIVQPDPVASTSTVHAPTAQPGAVSVAVGAVGSVAVVHAPVIVPGAVSVAVSAVTSVAVVHEPFVGSGSVVQPGAIVSGAVVHAPTLQPGAIAVQVGAIVSGEGVPAVSVAATVTIQPGAIAAGAVVHAPAIAGAQVVQPDAIAGGAVVHEPFVGGGSVVQPGAIVSGAVVHAPVIVPGAVSVAVSAVTSVAVVHEPITAPGAVSVAVSAIAGGSVVHAPAVESGAAIVAPGTVSSGAVVHAPAVQPGAVVVQVGTVASTSVVYTPGGNVTTVVVPAAIANGAVALSVALVVSVASRTYRVRADDRNVSVAAESRTITVEG